MAIHIYFLFFFNSFQRLNDNLPLPLYSLKENRKQKIISGPHMF